MPSVQSSYSETMPLAAAGMIADMTKADVDTRICETAAGIGFGLALGKGTADKGAVLGGALGIFVGVSVRDVTLPPDAADKYPQYKNMNVITKGDVYVAVTENVADGDVVHYNATTGAFAKSGGSGPIVGARYMTTAASGGFAVVRLTGSLPAA